MEKNSYKRATSCDWIRIPKSVKRGLLHSLPAISQLLYREFLERSHYQGYCEEEVFTLSQIVHLMDRQTREYIKLLVDKKLIFKLKGGRGHADIYIINDPDYLQSLAEQYPKIFNRLEKHLSVQNLTDSDRQYMTGPFAKEYYERQPTAGQKNKTGNKTGSPLPDKKDHSLLDYINNINTLSTLQDVSISQGNLALSHDPLGESVVNKNTDQNLNNSNDGKNSQNDLKSLRVAADKNTSDNLYYRTNYRKYFSEAELTEQFNKLCEVSLPKQIGNPKKGLKAFRKILEEFPDAAATIIAARKEQTRLYEMHTNGNHPFIPVPAYLFNWLPDLTWQKFIPEKKSTPKNKYPDPEFETTKDSDGRWWCNPNIHISTCQCEKCSSLKRANGPNLND